jgi:hypothetical protein
MLWGDREELTRLLLAVNHSDKSPDEKAALKVGGRGNSWTADSTTGLRPPLMYHHAGSRQTGC